jgi:hypothetical protein
MYMGGVGDWTDGINNPNANDQETANDIILKFQHSWGQIWDVRNSHVKWLKSFYGIAEPLPQYKKGTGASNMHVPLIEPLVDTICAKFFLTLLSNNPFIRFESDSSDKQDILAARILERTIKYLISDRIPGAREQMYLWIQDAVLYGQGFLHVYFDTISHTENSIQQMMQTVMDENGNPIRVPVYDALGQPIQPEVVETVTDYSGLRFEIIDINNLALDWSTADWRKSWVIIRERIDPEVYMERVKTSGYRPLTSEEIKTLAVGDTDYDNIQIEVDGKSGTTMGGEYNIDRKKIEIFHYYGKGYVPYFDKKGNVVDKIRQDCKMIVAGRRGQTGYRLIVVPPVPFGVKPLAMIKFKPKRGEALGRGVGAQIYDLQGELNVTRNQRMDAINFILNQGYIVDPGTLEDETDLNSRMGQIIHKADPMGKIEPIPRQQIPVEAWKHEDEIKADAQLVTSSADILRGNMERKETAFTANLRNSNAGQRLEAIVFRMGNEGLRELAEVMRALLAQFTPSNNAIIVKLAQDEYEKYAMELGEIIDHDTKTIRVTPDILKRTMYAIPNISALDGDNRAKSQELLQFMQIMQPYLQINPQTGMPIGWKDASGNTVLPDVGYFIREYARLNKLEVTNALITIPKLEVQQAQQQQQAQQMQLQAARGAGGPPQGNGLQGRSGPAEIAGQSMLTSPMESSNQQAAMEQMMANS